MIEITAIVPCFNGERFISSALTSIANQTLRTTEIILVDDGSVDRSTETAEAWQAAHPGTPLRIIRQANQGVSAARNSGLSKARTEWVAFLDVDDIWYPDHNEILSRLCRSVDDCALAFCDGDRADLNGTEGHMLPSFFTIAGIGDLVGSNGESRTHALHGPLHDRLLLSSFVPTCSNIARKSALLAAGGFETGRAYGEDRQMWLKLFLHGSVVVSREVAGLQRYHETNATHKRNNIKEQRAKIALCKYLLANREKYGIDERETQIVRSGLLKLNDELKYSITRTGILGMVSNHRTIEEETGGKYNVRDWARGIYSSFRSDI